MGELRRLPTAERFPTPRLVDPGESAGRVPPHDLDAEAAVLSAVLLDRAALLVVLDMLKPEHFFSLANARIYQAIQQLAIAGTPVDIVSVGVWLKDREWLQKMGGTAYLAQLADATPAVGHVAAHAEVVLEKAERRQLIATAQRVAAEGYGDVGSWEAYKATLRPELGRLTAPRMQLAGRAVGAVMAEARAHVRQAVAGDVLGVRYPWASVEGLVGLLVRKRQTILAGLSEHGKTTMAMQIVIGAARAELDASGFGEAVYVLTGEMPGPALLLRTACSLAGVDVLRVEAGLTSPDELREVERQMARIEALPIWIDDDPAPAAEVAKRVAKVKRMCESGRARDASGRLYPRCRMQLVMGDHVQDLSEKEQGRDDKERIATAARGWVDLIAKGCDVATLLLSQLREPDRAGPPPKFPPWPLARDLFGSPGKLKATADTILAVQRPELLMRDKVPAKWIGVAGVSRLKSRFGGEGRRALLGFHRGLFTEDLPVAARGEAHYEDDGG